MTTKKEQLPKVAHRRTTKTRQKELFQLDNPACFRLTTDFCMAWCQLPVFCIIHIAKWAHTGSGMLTKLTIGLGASLPHPPTLYVWKIVRCAQPFANKVSTAAVCTPPSCTWVAQMLANGRFSLLRSIHAFRNNRHANVAYGFTCLCRKCILVFFNQLPGEKRTVHFRQRWSRTHNAPWYREDTLERRDFCQTCNILLLGNHPLPWIGIAIGQALICASKKRYGITYLSQALVKARRKIIILYGEKIPAVSIP